MPARHVIDVENRIVLTRFTGSVTASDMSDHYVRLSADLAFDPSFSELTEFETSDVLLSDSDFRALVDIDPFATSSKRAFVVSSGQSVYGTARMYEILRADEGAVRLFGTVAQATSWLTEESQITLASRSEADHLEGRLNRRKDSAPRDIHSARVT